MMMRRAIRQCAKFHFDSCGSYFICGMFLFLLVLQVFYLLAFKWLLITVIIVSLLHYLSYVFIIMGIFVLLLKMGHGLRLIPHKLNNGAIQFEGYDSNNKHLFTFVLNDDSII